VIKRLVVRVRCVKPEFQESGSWYRLHSSNAVCEILTDRGIPVLSHPHYSSDLALADFFFQFPKLKIAMKETRFLAVSSVQRTVTRGLKMIREAFSRAFDPFMSDVNVVR
jgi:hypothetical protein